MTKVEIHEHRDYSIYYSDQLELLFEQFTFSVSLLTDQIAVVQEYSTDGDIICEYEIILSGTRKENIAFLQHYLPFTVIECSQAA